MALDPREFIRLHAGMPEHPKVDPLSDAAFRCLIEAWCLCRRTRNDGRIPLGTWQKKWKARARKELVEAGLVLLEKDAAIMRDWLEHQPSVEELDRKRQARVDAGRKGGTRSGESRRGASRPATKPEANASAVASPELERSLEQTPNQNEPELEIEKESSYVEGVSYVGTARENDPPPRTCPAHEDGSGGDCGDCRQAREVRREWRGTRIGVQLAPSPRCDRHRDVENPPNCGACKEARIEAEQFEAEHKARVLAGIARERRHLADDRARAVKDCPLCDGEGYVGTSLCSHDPDQAATARRGMEKVRAALAKKPSDSTEPPPEPVSPASVPTGRSESTTQDHSHSKESAHGAA